ncbi:MAG: hypothetical protein HY985_04455 [Magnetospirillum sp.]|nr:hypothetical protein [Magnetospirillum sp.]
MERVWRTVAGTPVSCVEKLKMLEQNLAEFRALAQDIVDDAVLMGCDVGQVREVLAHELRCLRSRYGAKD